MFAGDGNYISEAWNISLSMVVTLEDWTVSQIMCADHMHISKHMYMYGFELWNLNCNYVDEFRVGWRKIERRIWRLPNRAQNAIVQNLSYNIDDQLETRMITFIMIYADPYLCLSYIVKVHPFQQIIIISFVNMNCQIKVCN